MPGTWTFSGWNKDDFEITENTEITGSWKFEPDPCKVSYVVGDDPKWGAPADASVPTDDKSPYAYNSPVTVKDALKTTQGWAVDPDTGNKIAGTWVFSGWDKDDFNIKEDTAISGSWKFVPGTPGKQDDIDTGDSSMAALWIVLMTASAAAAFVSFKKKRELN